MGPRDTHVTILLSLYNGEAWLPELLSSVRAQSHSDWHLLVRDDGSSDRSVAVVADAAGDDDRIEVLTDDLGNLGPAGSYMHLLSRVDDGLFAFCDQDDVWLDHKLAWCVEALDGAPEIAAVYTDAEVVQADGTMRSPSALADHRAEPSVPFASLMLNNVAIGATMVGTAGLARRAVAAAGDAPVLMHDWWCAVLAAHGGELRCLPHPTIRWRRHGGNVTGETPATVVGRGARRRYYARWSIGAARRILAADLTPVDEHTDRVVRTLAAIDADRLPVSSFLHAWWAVGLRARPLHRQAGLLSAVVMGRSHQ